MTLRQAGPAVYQFPEFVAAGGLISYGDISTDVFRRAAGYVDRAVGDVTFTRDLPALKSFPNGRIDFPNALAYAPLMRGGQPIYEDFSRQHLAAGRADAPVFLCLNATRSTTTAIAAQFGLRSRIAQKIAATTHSSAMPIVNYNHAGSNNA